ncbi:MAG TPA: TIGR03618 family F420-dependent PPOX class oxidoreductase [Actinomycetota bacterium]|nr:TIGR03618 family F420-dependent PPOX class oxidoreductase [Actinomycetota bacterium]
MPRDIPIDDLLGFLDRPITSVLATRAPDGRVRLSPVWHEWRDGGLNVVALAGTEKVRHIRRDPRVSFVVAEQASPWTGVELRCEATILTEAVEEVARRINVRYEGAERGEDFTQETAPGPVILRLEPGELRTWNSADEEGE